MFGNIKISCKEGQLYDHKADIKLIILWRNGAHSEIEFSHLKSKKLFTLRYVVVTIFAINTDINFMTQGYRCRASSLQEYNA